MFKKETLWTSFGALLVVIVFLSGLHLYFNQQQYPIETNSLTAASALVPGGFIFGVTASEIDATKQKNFMDGLNLTSTRTWLEVTDWNTPPTSARFDKLRAYQAKGIKTVMVFNSPENPTSNPTYIQAYNYFKAAAKAANGAIDYWEIGNEPNLDTYWKGHSMSDYVKTLGKGAWDALHPLGEVVVCGAPSWDTNTLKTAGYVDNCDIVAFHPYGENATQHIQRVKTARTIIGNIKPLFITEWNIHGNYKKLTNEQWAAELPKVYEGTKNLVQGIWYYPSTARETMAGRAGLRTPNGTAPNEPFYSTYKNITGGKGGGIDSGGSGTGGNTGGNTGGGYEGGTGGGPGGYPGGGNTGGGIDPGTYGGPGTTTDYTGTDRNDVNHGEYTGPLSKCITDPSPANCADGLAAEQCKNAADVAACKKAFIDNNTSATTTAGTGLPPTPTITPSGAGGLIPCNGTDCDFADFIALIRNIINAMFIIAGPLAAISFSYAGWLYLTSQGNVTKTARAKSIFTTVLIGFIILLSAWLVVTTILTALLTPDVLNKLPIKLGS